MTTDGFHRTRKIGRNKRVEAVLETRKLKWLIICEGEKTEKYYFEGLKEYLNKNGTIEIEMIIEGHGKNTKSLVNSVEEYFEFVDKCHGSMRIPYQNIIFVFDKDSFPDGNFNDAIKMAEKYNNLVNRVIVAWSNESFELWLNLHFDLIVSALHRSQYNELLTKKFRDNKILSNKENYEDNGKNSKTLFQDIIKSNGNLSKAIKNSKKILIDHKDVTPAKANPCTLVYEAVEELAKEAGCVIK